MAVELATAYVSLVPSAKGMGRKIGSELGDELAGPLRKAGEDAGQEAGRSGAKGFGDGLKGGVALASAGALALGAGVAALLSKGFADALDIESATAKLNAQLGFTGEQAKLAGKIAGDVYADAYGESLGEVNEALKGVFQQGLVAEDDTPANIEAVTKSALNLTGVFDQDMPRAIAAVSTLLKNNLVGSSEEAFDILTRGFQEGVDKGEDLLDTFIEYPTQFRALGLSAADAMGILDQGLRGGARNADVVADALKEFAIRAQDGSELTADSFKRLGLDAEFMEAAIAQGGKGASSALDATFDALRQVEDPAERSQIAVGLFGTKAEDLAGALGTLDLTTAAQGLGKIAGAAEEVDKTFGGTTAARIESFKRKALQGLATFAGDVLIPAFDKASKFIQDVWPDIEQIAGRALTAIGDAWETHGRPAFEQLKEIAGTVVARVRQEWPEIQRIIATALTTAREVIAGFIDIVTTIWDQFGGKITTAVSTVWDSMKGTIEAALQVIRGVIQTVTSLIHGDWSGVWNGLKQIVSGVVNGIIELARSLLARIRLVLSVLGEVLGAIMRGAWEGAKQRTKEGIDAVLGFFKNLPGQIRGFAGAVLSAAVDIGAAIIRGIGNGLSKAVGIAGDIAGAVTRAAKGAVNAVIDKVNRAVEFTIGLPFGKKFTVNPPDIPHVHTGGIIPGGAGDEALRILEGGERVFTNQQARALSQMLTGAALPSQPVVITGNTFIGDGPSITRLLNAKISEGRRAGVQFLGA